MAIKLAIYGNTVGITERTTLRVCSACHPGGSNHRDLALLLSAIPTHQHEETFQEFGAVLTQSMEVFNHLARAKCRVVLIETLQAFRDGHIITVSPQSGYVRTIFRPESPHNTVFTTDRCNSNCLMCSQPPKDVDDSYLVAENLRMIELIDYAPEAIGITGGEPTLLGDGLVAILTALKAKLPQTHVHMLTNGRRYQDLNMVRELAAVAHPAFVSAIPLYADVAGVHDYIVQARGAFDETVEGLYNAAQVGLPVEIRIVLHKQSLPRLRQLTEFIYWNCPFAVHVAFMGLEHMGYVKKNWEDLWVDPVDYGDDLEWAVRYLFLRRMNVSIYNLQLCLLPKNLWGFARKSISDYKNEYLPECARCAVQEHCGGLFLSQLPRYSSFIHPISSR